MPLVEKRYAEALVDISIQQGAIDAFQDEFKCIVDNFNNQPEFTFFLLNPEIKIEIKKETIEKIFVNKVRPYLINFLKLLLDKGRINFLPGILEEFDKLADMKKNVLNISIISYEPLSEVQINEIKEKYRKMYNAISVNAKLETGKDLYGGIKVRIGDKIIDGTVKGRLDELKRLIVG